MTRLTARTRALAATALLALLPALASAAPLVTNGGFETGDLTGWTLAPVSPSFGVSSLTPQVGTYAGFSVCSGADCFSVTGTGVEGRGSISQVLNLTPGIYRLTYGLNSLSTTPTNRFGASLGNAVVHYIPDTVTTGYVNYADVTAVSGGLTTLAFAIRHDPSVQYLDNIALTMIDDGAGNNIAAVSQASAFQNTYGFLDRLQDRFGHAGSPVKVALNAPVETASSTGGYVSPTGKYRAYMSGYGDRSRWDGGDERGQRWGLSVGAELAVASSLDVGIALSAGHGKFSSDTLLTDNRGKSDEYVGAIYGHFSPDSLPLFITAAAGYGYTSTDLSRASLLGFGTAMALDVGSTQWLASVEVGYDWAVSNGLVITPFARADGARLRQDSYSEFVLVGGSLLPMDVPTIKQDAARTILGARGTLDLNVGRRGAKLTASAGWDHEFERDRAVSFSHTTISNPIGGADVTFAGTTSAANPAANSVVAGAGVEAPISDDARIFVGYNGNFASGQNNHAGEVGVRVNW